MIRSLTLALLTGATLNTAAAAQDATPSRDHPILRLDTNGDGQISLEEAQAAPANPMALADADGDGTLTREEAIAAAVARVTQRATERAGGMFDRFDEDGNGEIAIENLPQPRGGDRGDRIERMFERADADGDGVLSAEEIADLPERGRGGRMGGKHGGRHGDRG